MEFQGSLPRLQVPATCPYPESDQSSPCPPFHSERIQLSTILPSTPGSSNWSVTSWFRHQNLYAPLLSPYVLHALPISFFLILSPE